VLYVKGIERSGIAVGGLLLAQSLPHLLGPLTGTLVDRLNLKRLMVGCELAQALIFAVIAWWEPPFVGLLPLVVLAATVDTISRPASNSVLPVLVDHPDRMQANAWMGTSLNLQVVVGPFLGGFLASALGVRWALAANALSFILSAVLLVGLPQMMRPATDHVVGIFAAGFAGLRFAWRQPVIRSLISGWFLVVAFLAVENVALIFLTRDVLHATALGFGAVAAAFGVGMLLASIALSWLRSVPRSGSIVVAGWLLGAVGTSATGLAPDLGAAAALQALGGAGNGIHNVAAATLIQETVPTEMLGRVFGLLGTASSAGSSLAYVLAGLLLDATSPRATFIIGGVGALAATALVGPTLVRASRRRAS
jgi:MFS family permease